MPAPYLLRGCGACNSEHQRLSEAEIDRRPQWWCLAVMARSHFIAAASALVLAGCAHLNSPDCDRSSETEAEIEGTVHAFFDSLRGDDKATFQQLTTSSFYAFDVGKRYAGTELVDVVKDAHARGVQLNWSVGQLDTKIGCDVAWSAWEK